MNCKFYELDVAAKQEGDAMEEAYRRGETIPSAP